MVSFSRRPDLCPNVVEDSAAAGDAGMNNLRLNRLFQLMHFFGSRDMLGAWERGRLA